MKNRSLVSKFFCAQTLCGLLIAIATLGLSSCGQRYYKFPAYTYANRPIPPSKIDSRVLVGITVNGSSGSLEILDGKRDIRSSIFDANSSFHISGFSSGYPSTIINFPEQVRGYVYSDSDGSITNVNYSTEASTVVTPKLPTTSTSLAIPISFNHIYAALQAAGQIGIIDNTTGRTYGLNLPNVYKVFVNQGDTVVLAMVRNSDTLYRVIKLNSNQPAPAGSVDCQPFNLPVYCVVPVADSTTKPSFDRPNGAYFSLDGSSVYVLNCGPECGGSTAGVTVLQQGALTVDVNTPPYPAAVTNSVAIPGGATAAVANGTTLYLAGQQLQPDGLFAGRLTLLNLATLTPGAPISISDGNHTKMLFADDNTLWIGSQSCATGERQALGQNYNCLTRFDLGANTAQIFPNVTPNGSATVPYPNANQNPYYYGDLTGICWIQDQHKVYTAYGGQIHAFNTADGSEINNQFITVQGTALDVAYMDALTNAAN
ncbi:MAG TPA: hypothetical protein VIX90_11700 [Edaphobacter sp.]